jgi:hypothetical protein
MVKGKRARPRRGQGPAATDERRSAPSGALAGDADAPPAPGELLAERITRELEAFGYEPRPAAKRASPRKRPRAGKKGARE